MTTIEELIIRKVIGPFTAEMTVCDVIEICGAADSHDEEELTRPEILLYGDLEFCFHHSCPGTMSVDFQSDEPTFPPLIAGLLLELKTTRDYAVSLLNQNHIGFQINSFHGVSDDEFCEYITDNGVILLFCEDTLAKVSVVWSH